MEIEMETYGALCAMSTFVINGTMAESEDFGDKYDRATGNAEDYCCGDMHFTPRPSTPEILAKYKITEDEYKEIADKLEDMLSFGCCGWCS